MEPKCIPRVRNHCRHRTVTAVDCRDDNRRLWLDGRETDWDGSFVVASDLLADARRDAVTVSDTEVSVNFVGSFFPASFDCSLSVVFEAVEKISMVPEGFVLVTATGSVGDVRVSVKMSLRIH